MSHPLTEQLATMRLQRWRTDALLFVIVVSAGLTLLATAALQAPAGWFPLL
jgi:hypothetical protein